MNPPTFSSHAGFRIQPNKSLRNKDQWLCDWNTDRNSSIAGTTIDSWFKYAARWYHLYLPDQNHPIVTRMNEEELTRNPVYTLWKVQRSKLIWNPRMELVNPSLKINIIIRTVPIDYLICPSNYTQTIFQLLKLGSLGWPYGSWCRAKNTSNEFKSVLCCKSHSGVVKIWQAYMFVIHF